jgi:hypothetical protein
MTRAGLAPRERSVFRYFVDALRAFADDPGPASLDHYLRASLALEKSRAAPQERQQTARVAATRGDLA